MSKEKTESITKLFNKIYTLDIDSVIDNMSNFSDKDFKKLAISVSKELNKRKNYERK